jgi:hypothetical protein
MKAGVLSIARWPQTLLRRISKNEMRAVIVLLMMDNHIRLFSVINIFVSNYVFFDRDDRLPVLDPASALTSS